MKSKILISFFIITASFSGFAQSSTCTDGRWMTPPFPTCADKTRPSEYPVCAHPDHEFQVRVPGRIVQIKSPWILAGTADHSAAGEEYRSFCDLAITEGLLEEQGLPEADYFTRYTFQRKNWQIEEGTHWGVREDYFRDNDRRNGQWYQYTCQYGLTEYQYESRASESCWNELPEAEKYPNQTSGPTCLDESYESLFAMDEEAFGYSIDARVSYVFLSLDFNPFAEVPAEDYLESLNWSFYEDDQKAAAAPFASCTTCADIPDGLETQEKFEAQLNCVVSLTLKDQTLSYLNAVERQSVKSLVLEFNQLVYNQEVEVPEQLQDGYSDLVEMVLSL